MGGNRKEYDLLFAHRRLADRHLPVRVLQYRSVAFVTYKSELSAQFAKEAMACQSLDNDEILNVRWATEDPNPVSKEQEKQRLEEEGEEAIAARMDPRIVDAMRAVRALEEGVVLEDGDEDDLEDSPPAKRRKMLYTSSEVAETPRLLSADTLKGMEYFAEIRRQNFAGARTSTKEGAMLELVGYGSEEED